MPVMVGEVAYEGLTATNPEEVVRFGFWSAILSGEAGHTYGAGGIFEMESRKVPYGRTPHGDWDWHWMSLGTSPHFPGAQQIAWGKELLLQFEWWRLEPHPEWVEPHWTEEKYGCLTEHPSRESCSMVDLPTLLRDKPDALHQWVSPTISHLDQG